MNDPIEEFLNSVDDGQSGCHNPDQLLVALVRIYREANNRIIARYPSLIIALETEQKALEIIK